MIIQWGLAPAPSGNINTIVSFSVAFTSIPSVVVHPRGLHDSDFSTAAVGDIQITSSGFELDSNYGYGTKVRITWIAIGY